MKNRKHIDRRGLLALGGSALVLGSSGLHAAPSYRASPASAPPASTIRVRVPGGSTDPNALYSPALARARFDLKREALAPEEDEPVIRRVRRTLAELYGPAARQTSSLINYIWVWNGERWVLWCTSLTTFELDFGSYGAALVDVEDAVALR